jgi:hypothetical protein
MKKIETEAEWLACTDPTPMLEFLKGKASDRKLRLFGCACCRRIWHLIPTKEEYRCVEVAEQYADKSASDEELELSIRESMQPCRIVGSQGKLNWKQWMQVWTAASEAVKSFASCSSDFLLGLSAASTNLPIDSVDRTEGSVRSGAIVAASAWAIAELLKEGSNGSTERLELLRQEEQRRQTTLLRDIIGNPWRPVSLDPSWLTAAVSNLTATAYEDRALPSGQLDPARLAVIADALVDAGCMHFDLLAHCLEPGPHVRGCWVVDLILSKDR